jgi:hypothetical protein
MTVSYRGAISRQAAAAAARDPEALRAAAKALLAASPMHLVIRMRGDCHDARTIGSVLVAGRAREYAAAVRRVAYRQLDAAGAERPLPSIPEDEWNFIEVDLLGELRLLDHDWRGLPGFPERPDIIFLPPSERRRLRAVHAFLTGMAVRDGRAVKLAIAAIGRAESASFSMLAYALYGEARRAGVLSRIPRKYDF